MAIRNLSHMLVPTLAILLIGGSISELSAMPPYHPGPRPARVRFPHFPAINRFGFHFVIGARFPFLPPGCEVVFIDDFPYWYYDGIWFSYLPRERVYVVVDNPKSRRAVKASSHWDKLILTDGTVLEGIYLGGTEEKIKFQVGKDDIREYKLSQVASLILARNTKKAELTTPADTTATGEK